MGLKPILSCTFSTRVFATGALVPAADPSLKPVIDASKALIGFTPFAAARLASASRFTTKRKKKG